METKKHYKMYKSGKLWVSAAVATLALTAGMAYGSSANADTMQTSPQPPTQSAANPTTTVADKAAQANSQNKQGQAAPQPTTNNQNNNEVSGQNNKQDNQGKLLPGKQGTPTNVNKGEQGNEEQSKSETVTFTRTVNFLTRGADGKDTPNGADVVQNVDFTKITDSKVNVTWQGNTKQFTEVGISPKDGYYAQIDGKFVDKVPALVIDPSKDKLTTTIKVIYVLAKQTIKPTDAKADKTQQVKTVTRTIDFTAPKGAKLPDNFQRPIKQTVTFGRDMYIDVKDPKNVTYGPWNVTDGGWDKVNIQINGYDALVNNKTTQYIDKGDFSNPEKLQDEKVDVTYQLAAGNKGVDLNIKGNHGWLDSISIENNKLNVAGWNATNDSQGKPYHYIFVWANGQVIGKYQVDIDAAKNNRPDVPKVLNVWNAAKSGFNESITLDMSKVKVGDTITAMSRWTSDPAGNTVENQTVDFVFPKSVKITPSTNQGWLDNFGTYGNNQLKVGGWNATNLSLNCPYHWLILLDATTGKEIARQKVTSQDRPDVAKAYSGVLNADKSGFEGIFSLNGIDINHNLQLVSRYSTDMVNGEGQRVDYWFPAQKLMKGNTEIKGSLDTFEIKNGCVHVVGWNATDWSTVTQNHFLILLDSTSNKQVATKLISNISRPDVAKAYPSIKTAGNSGFDITFDPIVLIPGHTYTLVSRYSTSNQGNGDTGAKVTYWFINRHLTFNPNRTNVGHLDRFDISNGELQVKGWHATDMSELESNHWLILLDSNNREVDCVQVINAPRPDVAAVFKGIQTAGNSGFNAGFDKLELKPGTYTLISRYAIDPNDASQYTDYWFKNAITIDPKQHASYVDTFKENKDGSYQITGWMASNATMTMKVVHPFLILVNGKGQELGRTELALTPRSDVANIFSTIYNSATSGFDANLKLNKDVKIDKKTNEGLLLYLRFTEAKDGNPTAKLLADDQVNTGFMIKNGQFVKKA